MRKRQLPCEGFGRLILTRYGFITCPELSETYTRDVYVTHGASCLLWPMLDSPDRRSLFVFFALFVNPLQDYAGKWEVGTSVSFTVAVNDKGPPPASCVWLVLAVLLFTCDANVCSCALTGKPQARDVQQIDGDHREIVVDTSCYPRLAFQTSSHSVKLPSARSDQNLDQNYTSSPAGTGFVTPLSQPQMPATPLSQPQMLATPASSQLPMTPASQQPTPAATAPQRTRLPSSSWADMVDDDEEDGLLLHVPDVRHDPTSTVESSRPGAIRWTN